MGLDEISRVACNSGETQTLKPLLPLGREGLGTESLWQRGGKLFEALLNAAISKYIYIMEKLLILEWRNEDF